MTEKKYAWQSVSGVIGVRFREHPDRKFLRKPDRYFSIRYKVRGGDGAMRTREEGVGWASEGYSAAKAAELRATILQKIDELGRPYSLAELRSAHHDDQRDSRTRSILHAQREATFAHACARYLAWAEANKRSWKTDQSHIVSHLRPYLGAYRLLDITPTLVEAFRQHLMTCTGRNNPTAAKPLSVSTVNQCILLVSKIFNQSRLIPFRDDTPQIPVWSGENPCRQVKLPKATAKRWRVLTEAQEADILRLALDLRVVRVRKRYTTINHAMVFHDAILFALRTGARLDETCSLQWKFVDLDRNAIRLTDTKSGLDRTVYADPPCLDMLRRRAVRDPAETHVFWDANRPMVDERLTKAFKRLVDHLGLNDGFTRDEDKLVFHCLRHTYGTRAVMAGMHPLTLKKLMGHKSLTTTERYVHLAEEFLRGQSG